MPNPTIEDLKKGLLDLLGTPLIAQESAIKELVDMADLAGDSRYIQGYNKGAQDKADQLRAVLEPVVVEPVVSEPEKHHGYDMVNADTVVLKPRKRRIVSVKALGLSTKTTNALVSAGITKVKDLTEMSVKDLRAVPRIGAGSVKEIASALAKHNRKLAE